MEEQKFVKIFNGMGHSFRAIDTGELCSRAYFSAESVNDGLWCRVLRDNGFNHLFKDVLVSNSAYSTSSILVHLIIFQAAYL